MMRSSTVILLILVCSCANLHAGQDYGPILILDASSNSTDTQLISKTLAAEGYDVQAYGYDQYLSREPGAEGLIILPNANQIPVRIIPQLELHFRKGGDLVALKTPLGQSPLLQGPDGWVDRPNFIHALKDELFQQTILDFQNQDLSLWKRSTSHPQIRVSHRLEKDDDHMHVLHVRMDSVENWETYQSPVLNQPFGSEDDLTVLWAKGGAITQELMVEWAEKDGSRWIAVIPLQNEWQMYVLEPSDFHFWESVPSRSGTGFNPAHASHLTVGLALSHSQLTHGPQEYWLGNVGSATRTRWHQELLGSQSLPAWEILSPGYKFFPLGGAMNLRPVAEQAVLPPQNLAVPESLLGTHPRPSAAGFNKGRDWRWMPLIEAKTCCGDHCGYPAALYVHADGTYKNSIWASYSVQDPDWYRTPKIQKTILQVVQNILQGVFLIDAGADHFTYFENQAVNVGLRCLNTTHDNQEGIAASIRVLDSNDQVVFQQDWDFYLAGGQIHTVSATWHPSEWPEVGYQVRVDLLQNNQVVDKATHSIYGWKPQTGSSKVTVQNGDFQLDGQRWRALGVNYMPSSGIGTEDQPFFEYWLGSLSYDPVIIERDLKRIHALGLNSVSVFIYHDSMKAQNLLDFLRLCRKYNLQVNLSLRPGTPMNFEWEKIKDLIEYYRLWEQDQVFALDLAWEPMFGNHEARKEWDSDWLAWITDRYGSLESAEQDWGYSISRDSQGNPTNPENYQTQQDGDWRVMVAAYRRFLDTLLYRQYSQARSLVRELVPDKLISFRMTEAGNPTFKWDQTIPYDFAYLAGAVDLLEPEAYGRFGDWERVKPGWFQFEYARWAGPHLPMIWAEIGKHVWSVSRMNTPEENLVSQATFYRDFFRMMIASTADGVFFWWYPGGFRVNERSDYGIFNPDGSDRPVTQVIREQGPVFLSGPSTLPVNIWLEFDRDLHPSGMAAAYDLLKDDFWRLIDEGKVPGLKTMGTGTTSATAPLLAVGNRPLNGSNPPKFLDAFIDNLILIDGNNRQIHLPCTSQSSKLPKGFDSYVITITNLGEATWLAPTPDNTDGCVFLKIEEFPDFRQPIPRNIHRFESVQLEGVLPLLNTGEGKRTWTFYLDAEKRTRFGPRYQILGQ